MSRIQRTDHGFSLFISWKDIGYMVTILIALNLFDVVLTFYAINALGFAELNALAFDFPMWIFVLKFGICFSPWVCAYILHKIEMENYLLLPFLFSMILIEFYMVVVVFNLSNFFRL